jgi:hypothetical protein
MELRGAGSLLLVGGFHRGIPRRSGCTRGRGVHRATWFDAKGGARLAWRITPAAARALEQEAPSRDDLLRASSEGSHLIRYGRK